MNIQIGLISLSLSTQLSRCVEYHDNLSFVWKSTCTILILSNQWLSLILISFLFLMNRFNWDSCLTNNCQIKKQYEILSLTEMNLNIIQLKRSKYDVCFYVYVNFHMKENDIRSYAWLSTVQTFSCFFSLL